MDIKVRLGVRFEEKGLLDEFLNSDEANSTFNGVCYRIMDGYFLEKGTKDENARKKLICRIFNDVYSCATNVASQLYSERWGEHYRSDGDIWYKLPGGTDFSKYTMFKHLPLFMSMLWWLLYFVEDKPHSNFNKVARDVCCKIREKFNSEEELLVFRRFDCALGASEETVVDAIRTIAGEIEIIRHWKGVTDELRLVISYRSRIEREYRHRGGKHTEQILSHIVEDIESITGKSKIYNSIKRLEEYYPDVSFRFRQLLMELSPDISMD